MNIDKHVPNNDWKLPGGKPAPAPGKLEPLLPHGGPEPDPIPLKPFPSGDDWGKLKPGPNPLNPVVPCIGLEFRPDPIEEIEQIRSSHGGEQAMALMEFPDKLKIMDGGQLAKAEAYLRREIAKPYNNDDSLLKALLNAVDNEQNSRKPFPPDPFPPKPWIHGGDRKVD